MFKDFLLVGIGSFFGGGARLLVSRWVQQLTAVPFPFGTLTVNALGCLLIGFLYGLNWTEGWMSPTTKLILTTGFCGGFTTFSTFMSETTTMHRDGNNIYVLLYIIGSLALGAFMVVAGNYIAKIIQG